MRGVNYRITVRMVNEESEKARTVIVIWEDIPVNTEESGEPFSLTSFEVEYIWFVIILNYKLLFFILNFNYYEH